MLKVQISLAIPNKCITFAVAKQNKEYFTKIEIDAMIKDKNEEADLKSISRDALKN